MGIVRCTINRDTIFVLSFAVVAVIILLIKRIKRTFDAIFEHSPSVCCYVWIIQDIRRSSEACFKQLLKRGGKIYRPARGAASFGALCHRKRIQ